MEQALELAASVMLITSPNPRVACLLVRDGVVLASGATQQAGGPHAEAMALHQAAQAGLDVAGSTIYVTLEPCSHYGRTPPCVQALVQAKPARVVIAMADPNPLVSGQGIQQLQAAGIQVTVGVCAEQALAINPGFVARMTRKTPWVWVKMASTLDGRIALNNGESQWITGPAARADGHWWRARSCAILTGSGTVLADDPLLTVRDVAATRTPLRAIVDSRLQVPVSARIFNGDKVVVFTCQHQPEKVAQLADKNVQVVQLPEQAGRVDLPAVMRWLADHDINEVHTEAGAQLSGALLEADCVDELLLYMAPMLLGEGLPMAVLQPLQSLAHARCFEFTRTLSLGSDLRIQARHPQRWQALLHAIQYQQIKE
ncbi:bifunctional diaminohydroxyphosphoribosylaminopyrimidine deaminase/5-amino-6-(5-phosphoribosylamino)uracil reductase RibD [Alcaligenaceae bacterium]|nr:bifunctional diaminohydroxyphosphoribosylaminopyrimidine deaminase/5-amino-6-(5-phosphoribosylamino)uracil reductase RibD [Alcaligenaceae bacterium]